MRSILIPVVVLALAAPASAAPRGVSVDVSLEGRWTLDRALDLVSEVDGMGGFGLRVGWDALGAGKALTLVGGWTFTGPPQTTAFQSSWTTQLDVHAFEAGARWRFLEGGHGELYAKGALLLDLATLTIRSGLAPEVSDTALGGGVALALGAASRLSVQTESGFSLWTLVELGWGQRLVPARFALEPAVEGEPKPAPIAFVPVQAGSLSLTGPYFRVGLDLRF